MKTLNKITGLVLSILIVTFTLILPIQIGAAYAADNEFLTANAPGGERRSDVQNTCGFTQPGNIKDSFVLSVVFMCIPGILEKVQELRNIRCQEVVCYYESVKSNLDPSYCSKQAAYSTCTYVTGEIFAIPPMSILENMRSFIANILANPVGIAYGAVMKLTRKYATSCGPAATCDPTVGQGTAMLVLGVNDIISVIQTFKEIAENGLWPSSEDNACEELEGIKEEMLEIINAVDEEINTTSTSRTSSTTELTTEEDENEEEDTEEEDTITDSTLVTE